MSKQNKNKTETKPRVSFFEDDSKEEMLVQTSIVGISLLYNLLLDTFE